MLLRLQRYRSAGIRLRLFLMTCIKQYQMSKKESGSKESGRAEEVRRNIEKQSCDANFLEALIDEAAGVTTEYEDKFKAMGLAINMCARKREIIGAVSKRNEEAKEHQCDALFIF